MLIGSIQHQINIICSSVMILIVKTVRVCKMRTSHGKGSCLIVHHLNEILYTSAYLTGNRHSSIVGRINQQCMEKLIHRYRIAHGQSTHLGSIFQRKILFCDRYLRIRLVVFHGKESRHDLRDAGRVDLIIHILREQYFFVIQIKQSGLYL